MRTMFYSDSAPAIGSMYPWTSSMTSMRCLRRSYLDLTDSVTVSP